MNRTSFKSSFLIPERNFTLEGNNSIASAKALNILKSLEFYLKNNVSPKKADISTKTASLKAAFHGLAKNNFLSARIPNIYGGLGLSHTEYHFFKKLMARYSVDLTFLQTQHQTAAQVIYKGHNEKLKSQYLAQMATGKISVGMALSHLENLDKPLLHAESCQEGFLIKEGTVRFATGFEIFDKLIIGFVAHKPHEECEVTGIIPFEPFLKKDSFFKISEKHVLLCCQSSNTISFEIKNLLIPDENIILKEPLGSFHQKSQYNTNVDSYMAGVISFLLEFIREEKNGEPTKNVINGYQLLLEKLNIYEKMILNRGKNTRVAPIRVYGIKLCDEALAFSRQLFRGGIMLANSLISEKLQQISHERDLYSVITAHDDLFEETILSMKS